MDWFSVDKEGLAKLVDRRGRAFVLHELIQNCWDTKAERITVALVPIPGRPLVSLYVEDDDPNGFSNLDHAFTLFAESEKKGDPNRRGRFNLGEKLVLALCEEAEIRTTSGTVRFDKEGRHRSKTKTQRGSSFLANIRMTREEMAEALASVKRLLPPEGVVTLVNDEPLVHRAPTHKFKALLPTELSDGEGRVRRSARNARVTLHEVQEGETATLYEMGIPVVELDGGEPWHVNVHQKVPLSFERDNVTPAYLRAVRVAMLNATFQELGQEDASKPWITVATEDEKAHPEAIGAMLDGRFGRARASTDPSDPEAGKQLLNEGFTVIPGGSLSGAQWALVKKHGLVLPAGQIRPSGVKYDPEGRLERLIHPAEYTEGMCRMVAYLVGITGGIVDFHVNFAIVNEPTRPFAAWYSRGDRVLKFNLGRLGHKWFDGPATDSHHELLVHELAHDVVEDHLTREFADEVGRLGCRLARLAFQRPDLFRPLFEP